MNVLEARSLEKKYKEKLAVKDISFSLTKGKCTALLGPNGAGKTTTLNMLAGLIKPTSGEIRSPLSKEKDIRTIIGYLPQYPSFFEWMSGEEYLIFQGEIAGISKKDVIKRGNMLLELVGLTEGKKRKIGQYSGGMKQRLGIAQAMIHQPNLLILDEPVSALDPFGRKEVLELLKNLKKEITILFSTHILNDAEQVCDDVLFLHSGNLVEQGSLEEVKHRHQTPQLIVCLESDSKKYLNSIQKRDWVKSANFEENTLFINVENIQSSRDKLFQIIAEEAWPVVKLETSNDSLEEVFMKVVK
jgi:ABC-2 type transport system ATP-binding protein